MSDTLQFDNLRWGISWVSKAGSIKLCKAVTLPDVLQSTGNTPDFTHPTPSTPPTQPTPISKSISSIRGPHLPQICHRSSRNSTPLVDNIVCGKTPLFKQCYQQTKLKKGKLSCYNIYITATLKTSSPAWLRCMKMNMRPLCVDVGSLTF